VPYRNQLRAPLARLPVAPDRGTRDYARSGHGMSRLCQKRFGHDRLAEMSTKRRNPHAVALGRKGGKKGGPKGGRVRMAQLTGEERRELARKAARARWRKRAAR
jgi:hypothetical protein